MDFTYPQEAEAFRKEFRTWLDGDLRALGFRSHSVGPFGAISLVVYRRS